MLPVDGRYVVDVNDVFFAESGAYRIAAHTVAPTALDPEAPLGAVLMLDGPAADVWSFDGTAGQVVDVAVTADTFEARYRLFSPGGEVIRAGYDRATVPLPEDGRYLLGVMVGGTFGMDDTDGAYEVSVRRAPVRPLAVDAPVTGADGWRRAGDGQAAGDGQDGYRFLHRRAEDRDRLPPFATIPMKMRDCSSSAGGGAVPRPGTGALRLLDEAEHHVVRDRAAFGCRAAVTVSRRTCHGAAGLLPRAAASGGWASCDR